MPQEITPLQAALWWAGHGHGVIPLHSITDDSRCTCGQGDCHSPGKHPFAPFAPNGIKNATTDDAVIRDWFGEHYWLNYGISCERLAVVDIDPRNKGDEAWKELCGRPDRPLIHTWTVRTGKYGPTYGTHIVFNNTTGLHKGDLDTGIELQAKGGYIVGVKSKHWTGVTYEWAHQSAPTDVPICEPPAWLLAVIKNRSHCGRPRSAQEWRTIAGTKVADGERHSKLNQMIGHLIGLGADAVVVRDLMLGWNRGMCEPPLVDREVTKAVENIAARELQKQNWITK